MTLKELQNSNLERLEYRKKQNLQADEVYIEQIDKLGEAEKQKTKELWNTYELARRDFENKYNVFSGQITTFQEQLRFLIDAKNELNRDRKPITYQTLAEDIGISERTLSRYSNGHLSPSINVVIMICVLLELDIKQSAALLTSLGLCLLGTSRTHYAYMYLLEHYRCSKKSGKEKIEDCNKLLTGLHIPKKDQLYPRSILHKKDEL